MPAPGSRLDEYYTAGLELFSAGRYEEAAGRFEKALQLERQHPGSLKHLGLALTHLGKHSGAVQKFQEYLALEPENVEVLGFGGEAYLELKRYEDAERCYRKALTADPKCIRAYLGLGYVLYRKGLYAEASGVLKKADEQEKDHPEILFLLGEAYNKLDELDLAIACFATILKTEQENPKVYYNLGILYDKKGQPAKASPMYRRAKELSSPQAARQLAKLVPHAAGEDMFFSRSLTVVEQVSPEAEKSNALDKARYEKFRKTQLRRKPHQILPDGEQTREMIGTMDLTKASLKINEAIKLIKERNR